MYERVLITGGTGFIGSNLAVACCLNGWHTTIVDRELNQWHEWSHEMNEAGGPGFAFIYDDMTSKQSLDKIRSDQFDVIFHLAALPRVSYSVEHPVETTEENILKSVKVLEAAKGNCRRFVFASSSSVYGGADDLPIRESHPLSPRSPYALQKAVIEQYCRMFGKLYNMETVCLRFFNVFGPRQLGDSPYSTAVSAWCHAIKNGLPLRKDGDGTQSRDMTYVSNVVGACIAAAESDEKFLGEPFNVGYGAAVSNNQIIDHLKGIYPEIAVQQAPFRAGDVMHTLASVDQAHRAFGYVPRIDFWQGLRFTLRWWGLREDPR